MKFSTIFAQGLLLSGIIASPVADQVAIPVADSVPDSAGFSVVSSLPDLDSEILSNGDETLIQKKNKEKLCFDTGKDKGCHFGNFHKCVPYYTTTLQLSCQQGDATLRMACLAQQPTIANQYCGFWCAEIKTIKDCENANKRTGLSYNCKKFDYC
ncbi:putative secreted protein [Wickerhamomyces ciferrii]|uniref:Secreted protein n=1 Tax=Wickerhamomyces ciferrii (strain ATCC 14091 / BCRC 22168 / CBS 111 / JCM 3599 / NBRC 0793 / NRRL Y-1031 F-60-10) TaxID=1206466 RepID=K0KJS2_WICCF|nr:uncharacterized protein BN7_887 [Wickerhamomyces ciferrii]CCH41348.1 putative secreted protein [Wickerhamomyces ciferrii]